MAETVSQRIDGDAAVTLVKEIVAAPLPDGGSVSLVRKRPPGTPRAAVLLLHGFAQNRYSWHLSRRSFSAYLVSRGYDVWNLELRGHGRSREGSSLPASFEDHVERDVEAAVRALFSAGHDRFFLVGHSLGGAIAYAAAPRLGSRVRGVVTLAGMFRWGSGARAVRLLVPLLHAADRLHRSAGIAAGAPIPMDLVGRLVALQLPLFTRVLPVPAGAWVRGGVEPDVLREWLTTAFDRTSGSILALMGRWGRTGRFDDTRGQVDYAVEWSHCRVPVLVTAADADGLADAEADVRPAFEAAASPDKSFRLFGTKEDGVPFGHIDPLIARHAPRAVWPLVAGWLDAH